MTPTLHIPDFLRMAASDVLYSSSFSMSVAAFCPPLYICHQRKLIEGNKVTYGLPVHHNEIGKMG